MVAHGQLRSNPQFEMQENGSKQNLLSPGNEVSENTPWRNHRGKQNITVISSEIRKKNYPFSVLHDFLISVKMHTNGLTNGIEGIQCPFLRI